MRPGHPEDQTRSGEVAMKVTVIYESIYGNTAAIAEAIAEGLRTHSEVELRAVDDVPVTADLLVLGAPTHGHGLPDSDRTAIEMAAEKTLARGDRLEYHPTAGMRRFIDSLPKTQGMGVACFDTRFDKSAILTGSAAKTMAGKLRRLGYRIVVDPESFFVLHTEGPLKEAELDRARDWGTSLPVSSV
jgi:flavodoxin